MARMLRALKNLEARSPRPAAEKTRSTAAVKPVVPRRAPPAAEPAPSSSELTEERATLEMRQAPPGLVRPQRRAEPPVPVTLLTPIEQPAANPLPQIQIQPTLPLPAPQRSETEFGIPPALPEPKPAAALPSRGATNVERQVRRTLSDPIRSRAIRDLAERLKRDAEQTQSKNIVLVGLGSESVTHETLLYVATLLADDVLGDVLLVDGDLTRKPLSEALEAGQQTGVSELISEEAHQVRELCRPTATDKLLFLPAGLSRHVDLSTEGPRLEQLLSQLRAAFALVLIDGGRAADLAASALARQADGAYFVVRLGTVETSEAQSELASFRTAGARVLGCIAT